MESVWVQRVQIVEAWSDLTESLEQQGVCCVSEPGVGVVLGSWVVSVPQLDSKRNLLPPRRPQSGAVPAAGRETGPERWRAGVCDAGDSV